jgi:hypothetical protein
MCALRPCLHFVIDFIDLNQPTIHWKSFVQKTQIEVCQNKIKWSILFVSCLGISYKEFIKLTHYCLIIVIAYRKYLGLTN